MGILERSDQRMALQYFRTRLNQLLRKRGYQLQQQSYDRVLKNNDRQDEAVEDLVEYIARNPERAGLFPVDGYRDYEFTGAVIPGYPEIRIWQDRYWDRFWTTYSYLRKNGLLRLAS